MEIPAVSVIIPMFNAEKYIGECLESILNQTFPNFEVIVVDDCSTDSSLAIVKSYAEKFGGRLTFSKTQKNSGGGGYVPRNIGLKLSRGEYIFFVDADDFIINNALEILYTAAIKYNADVVYTSYCYAFFKSEEVELVPDEEGNLENKITLITEAPNKNLQRLLYKGGFRNPWTKFTRRNFLIENNIVFPEIISGGDFIWTIHLFSHSKRFLRLPVALYFYRNYSSESVSRKQRTPSEQIFHWLSVFIAWLKALNELSEQVEILNKNSQYCFQALAIQFDHCISCCSEGLEQMSNQEIYDILYREFVKRNDSSNLMLPFFFSVINAQKKKVFELQRHIDELESKE